MLRRGFVDDERTVQMREDGWLNLSVVPQELPIVKNGLIVYVVRRICYNETKEMILWLPYPHKSASTLR